MRHQKDCFIKDWLQETLSENFGLVFEGEIDIGKKGTYNFRLGSDDGSRLFINNKMVVENDGVHGMVAKNGKIELEQGRAKLRLEYFEKSGQEEDRQKGMKLREQIDWDENIKDVIAAREAISSTGKIGIAHATAERIKSDPGGVAFTGGAETVESFQV